MLRLRVGGGGVGGYRRRGISWVRIGVGGGGVGGVHWSGALEWCTGVVHWSGALEREKEHKGNFTTNRRNPLYYQRFCVV